MFPAATAAPFAQNVVCRGILVICFSVFKIYYESSVTSRGSDKPLCHGDVKVLYGYHDY